MTVAVSLDIGTSTLCALALHVETAEPLALRCVANTADAAGLPDGFHEQAPGQLWEQSLELLADLLDDKALRRKDVVAVAVTGQMHGVLLVDPDLRPVTNLITWRDRRVLQSGMSGNLNEIRGAIDAAAVKRAGCRLHAGYGGATLCHLARNGELPKDVTALSITDYIAARLTGVAATEPTQAASWGLLDLPRRQWDARTVRRLEIPAAILPPLRETATPLAAARRELVRSLGLRSGVQVFLPIGDNQASVIGAAGLAGDAAVVNLGTGGQVSIPSAKPAPVRAEAFETRPMPFGGYVLVGASLCGGWSYAYLRRFMQDVVRQLTGVELDEDRVYERMNCLAHGTATGAAGLKALTRFNGSRADPDSRGMICGIDAQNFTPGNLARAFVEGMVGELAELFHTVDTRGVARIVASGNAARKNEVVVRTIEEQFGRQCSVSRCPEDAAFGAAHAAASALGAGSDGSRTKHHAPHLFVPSPATSAARRRTRSG